MDIPFCIFFARNTRPAPDHRFYYSAPSYERELNGRGRFRIDYEATQPLSTARVLRQPWLLKTLSLGTWLDVELMETLMNPSSNLTLGERWIEWDPKKKKTGKGYDRSPESAQKFVDFLADLKVFEPPIDGFTIQHDSLRTYGDLFGKNRQGQCGAHMPRREELFQPKVVIIPEAPGDDAMAPKAYISSQSIAFSKSYYGYSCAGHSEAETLAALIFLLPHSTLFAYFCLMTSRRSGFDRQTFNKEEFDALPFPDLAKLPARTKTTICSLAQRLQQEANKPWREIDEFLFHLYGLDADAVQVAKDTLFSAVSYRKAGKAALERTARDTRAEFVSTLRDALEPYFDVCGEHAAVREAEFQVDTWREPWFFLSISRETDSVPVNTNLMRKAMDAANQRGCSRIIVHAPRKRGLLLGLLNQRRWWTATRARLCAQHIIRERLGDFGLIEQS